VRTFFPFLPVFSRLSLEDWTEALEKKRPMYTSSDLLVEHTLRTGRFPRRGWEGRSLRR
jgi:hypothetical protein